MMLGVIVGFRYDEEQERDGAIASLYRAGGASYLLDRKGERICQRIHGGQGLRQPLSDSSSIAFLEARLIVPQ